MVTLSNVHGFDCIVLANPSQVEVRIPPDKLGDGHPLGAATVAVDDVLGGDANDGVGVDQIIRPGNKQVADLEGLIEVRVGAIRLLAEDSNGLTNADVRIVVGAANDWVFQTSDLDELAHTE